MLAAASRASSVTSSRGGTRATLKNTLWKREGREGAKGAINGEMCVAMVTAALNEPQNSIDVGY